MTVFQHIVNISCRWNAADG